MKNKQYPLHHDHGTVTISRDVFESMTAELERLRPMEVSLELAEANRDAYKKRVEELLDKLNKLAKDHDKAIQACCDADKQISRFRWISPKDKLPTEGQEVEFIATHTYACGISDRRRFQGHFRQAELDSHVMIFYAHSIGWGCEFAIDEVEYWMPKVPVPEEVKSFIVRGADVICLR